MVSPYYKRETGATTDLGVERIVDACCPSCKGRGFIKTERVYSGLYHDFGALSEFSKPDLVVLPFNSARAGGFSKPVEEWKPTTKFLVDVSVPTVCTEIIDHVAVNDLAELNVLGANVLLELEINPWRSLVPVFGAPLPVLSIHLPGKEVEFMHNVKWHFSVFMSQY
ncbi:hypothetical protein HYALB_00003799 [Hymenoscyphus albidus]|uniref:Mitochondrial splicing suppressor 51-like C-terminal domain-containing protein n=1 Tax=Hymenoscyphus albidus TaxID=595503 RepID=A0A9N9Q5V8_9HELO|nr:hypothetical protein HYALB_00003799 [Hymenoscyphus albidus]